MSQVTACQVARTAIATTWCRSKYRRSVPSPVIDIQSGAINNFCKTLAAQKR